MAREVICQICREKFKREEVEFIQKSTGFYHKGCIDEKEKNKAKTIEGLTQEEDKLRKELYEYICRLFNLKKPGPKNFQLIKNYIERGISYESIMNALKYFYEVKKGNKEKADERIGIVPYVYEEANEYFKKKEDKAAIIAENLNKTSGKEVRKLEIKGANEKKISLINLDEIEKEE